MQVFGYLAAAVLFATLLIQIRTQWARGTTRGVSRWLFIGQLVASLGFTVHSALIGSTLFVVVNALLAVSATVGIVIWFVLHRREQRGGGGRPSKDSQPPLRGGLTTEVRA